MNQKNLKLHPSLQGSSEPGALPDGLKKPKWFFRSCQPSNQLKSILNMNLNLTNKLRATLGGLLLVAAASVSAQQKFKWTNYDSLPTSITPSGMLVDVLSLNFDPSTHRGNANDPTTDLNTSHQLRSQLNRFSFGQLDTFSFTQELQDIGAQTRGQYQRALVVNLFRGEILDPIGPDSLHFAFDTTSGNFRLANPNYVAPTRTFITASLSFPELLTFNDSLIIPSALFKTNLSGTPQFKAQLSNGQIINLNMNQPYAFSTLMSGTLTFGANYTLNLILEFNGQMHYVNVPVVAKPVSTSFSEVVKYFNRYSDAPCNLYYPYEPSETRLTRLYPTSAMNKPVIIVEGFDPDENPNDNIYGTIQTEAYTHGIASSQSQIGKIKDLVDHLRSRGHSVFVFDYKNPGQRVESHAFSLINAIKWVNDNKTDDEEIIIMGASMGGLVSRYALTYMEKFDCKHCVKAYISFDAPHQGANIPVGLQYMVRSFAQKLDNISPSVKVKYNNTLLTDAAKQMLIFHISPDAANLRTTLYSELNNMGMPKYCKNFTVVNGNLNNQKLGHILPGDNLYSLDLGYTRVINTYFAKVHTTSYLNNSTSVHDFYLLNLNNHPISHKTNQHINFDNYPGGTVGTGDEIMKEINESLDKQKLLKTKRHIVVGSHNFIPIFSALNLIQYEYGGVIQPNDILKVWDGYYAPSTNEKHVEITNANLNWMYDLIAKLDAKPDAQLPNSFGNVYNYSFNEFAPVKSVQVNSNGKLWFNKDGRTAYQQSFNVIAPPKARKWRTSSCGAVIKMMNGSQMQVGDGLTRTAELTIGKGSTLELHPQSHLVITEGSKLIIEEGANLVVHPNTIIDLTGANAILEINGKLILENGATFKFASVANGSKLVWGAKLDAINNYNLYTTAPGAAFEIQGNKFFTLVLKSGAIIQPPAAFRSQGFELANFSLRGITVELHDGAVIDVASKLDVYQTTFNGMQPRTSSALRTYGQANTYIRANIFNNLHVGIEALNSTLNNPIEILSCVFQDNRYGAIIDGGSNSKVISGKAIGNDFGILIQNGAAFNEVRSTQFLNNHNGISQEQSCDLYVIGASFINNSSAGIIANGYAPTTVACSYFENNGIGISANGALNISMSHQLVGSAYTGGDNHFFANQLAIYLNNADIFLDNGFNSFTPLMMNNPMSIQGNLPVFTVYPAPMNIPARNNYWIGLAQNSQLTNANNRAYHILRGTGLVRLTGVVIPGARPKCNIVEQVNEDPMLPPVLPGIIPGAPNAGGDLSTSLPSFNKTITELYPNPTKGNIAVKGLLDDEQVLINVMDVSGKIVANYVLNPVEGLVKFNLPSDLANGAYQIKVTQFNEMSNHQIILNR